MRLSEKAWQISGKKILQRTALGKEQRNCRRFFVSIAGAVEVKLKPMICAVVIPCLNEGAGIAVLVSALRRQVPVVLVVDDGSTDDTALAAKSAGATVIHHERNNGKGAALRTGLSQLFKQGFEWAVTLDGDGQHAP